MTGTRLSPADWPFEVTAGDSLVPTRFTLEVDDVEWVVTEAIAQVRRSQSRDAELVMDLAVDFASNVVTVGDWEEIPVDVGDWAWDLQVTGTVDGDAFGPLTAVGGTFSIVGDVSIEEGS